jgi:hypothetical protein
MSIHPRTSPLCREGWGRNSAGVSVSVSLVVSVGCQLPVGSVRSSAFASQIVFVLASIFPFFNVQSSLRKLENDNDHDQTRPIADTFPRPPDTDTGTDTSPSLPQKLGRQLETFGQQGAPILI